MGRTRGTGGRYLRPRAVVLVVMAMLAVACSGTDPPKTQQTGSSEPKPITATSGGTVSFGSATVTFPPGALSADTTVTVARRAEPSSRPASPYLRPLGASYEIDAGTARIVKPVEVSLAVDTASLPANLPPEAFVLAYFDPSSKTWHGVDTTVDASRRTLRAPSDHLSEWQAFAADTSGLSTALVSAANNAVAAAGGNAGQTCQPNAETAPQTPIKLTRIPNELKLGACVEGTATQIVQTVKLVNNYGQPVLVDFSSPDPSVRGDYGTAPKPPNRFEQAVRDRLYPLDLLYVMPGESFTMRTTFTSSGSGTAYYRISTIVPAVIHFITEVPLVGDFVKAVPCIADYALAYRPSKTATPSEYKPVVEAAVKCFVEIWIDIVARGWRVLEAMKNGIDVVKLVDALGRLGDAQAAGGYFTLVRTATSSQPQAPSVTSPSTTSPPASRPPRITGTSQYREGVLVYLRVNFTDPDGDASGFGFRGANGSGWGYQVQSFADPAHGRISPDRVDYPFNHGCGTSTQNASDVEFWISDSKGNNSPSVVVRLTC